MKFKYSKTFKNILKGMKDDIAKKLIKSEDKKSNNLIDITDKKQFLKCVIDSHVQNMRCGKVIKKLIPDAKTVEVEVFVNKFRSKIFNCTFEIVKGEDLIKYYQKNTYYKKPENESSLYASCMTDMKPSTFDIYTKNNVRLIILKDNDTDKILGRALLWDNINGDNVSMMDRPYVAFQSLEWKFNDFAEENNFFVWRDINNEDLEYQLQYVDMERFPYCDTFKLLNPDNKLTNSYIDYDTVIDGEVYKELDCTGGSCTVHKGVQYFESIDDQVGKYTFDWDNIKKCKLDDRSYKKDNIGSNGIHKEYQHYWKSRFRHISDLSEFDFKNNKLICRLFLLTIKDEFSSNSIMSNKDLLRDGYASMRGFDNTDVYGYNNIKYKVTGKRMREITFPIQIRKSPYSFHDENKQHKYFLKFKLMPSGLKLTVMKSVKVTLDLDDIGYKSDWEIVGDSFYNLKVKSLKDFIHNKYNQLYYDVKRLSNRN